MNFVKRHFPENGAKWNVYAKVFIPIVLGSLLFALNGVVDNFMVGHIEQGQAALGAINSWTSILIGWFVGTASAGSVITGQFYFAKKYKIVKEIARYRYYLCLFPAIILAIVAWTAPDILTNTFKQKPSSNDPTKMAAYNTIMSNARDYARVIAVQWILISITFNLGNQLREIGFGFYTMLWGVGTLAANVSLNSVLMYGLGMGVEGAAWASVAGRIVALTSGITIIIIKKIKIGFMPYTIFNVSWNTKKLFWKRWIYILSVFTVTFFVIYRTSLYSRGYPEGPIGQITNPDRMYLGVGVGGLSVVSLTGALINIFTTTFNALTSMSSTFVGSELGKGNIEQARKNGDELKGFMTSISLGFSLVMAGFALLIPYMSFLALTKVNTLGVITFDGSAQLHQVSQAMLIISLYYPIWIWFSSSYRIGNSGGKGAKFALVDWVVSGLQLAWLFLIVGTIIPGWEYAETHFWITYIIFFLSDLLKLVGQEILYYRYNWLNILTNEEEKGKEASSKDISEITEVNRR